jgi:hypothetical protein
MNLRSLAVMLVAGGLAVTAPARATDDAKARCKADCRETLLSCKQDCQVDRDSGDLEASGRYRECDQSCHDAYAGCTSSCEPQ